MDQLDHLFVQPRDWTKSFEFYTNALGWTVDHQFGDAKDASRFANLAFGAFKMVLAEDHDLANPAGKPQVYQTKGKISLHFSTPDVDAAFAKIKKGAHVITPPENTHWGTRWFVVEDPDGNQFAWQGPAV